MATPKRAKNGGRGTCEDCGNKAKRDCEHKRCRTCCKSRAFECATHVRSTWVPVSRRREMLHHRFTAASSALPFHLITSPSSSSSGFQGRVQTIPAEVTSMANFRYVRVTSDDNAVDHAAYQTSVNIAGRVFTGLLYDQGPLDSGNGAESSLNDHLYRHHQSAAGGGVGGLNLPYLQYPYYAANAIPGMQFFPHPKP